jgi:hypothetical protein
MIRELPAGDRQRVHEPHRQAIVSVLEGVKYASLRAMTSQRRSCGRAPIVCPTRCSMRTAHSRDRRRPDARSAPAGNRRPSRRGK